MNTRTLLISTREDGICGENVSCQLVRHSEVSVPTVLSKWPIGKVRPRPGMSSWQNDAGVRSVPAASWVTLSPGPCRGTLIGSSPGIRRGGARQALCEAGWVGEPCGRPGRTVSSRHRTLDRVIPCRHSSHQPFRAERRNPRRRLHGKETLSATGGFLDISRVRG